jgi:hypothetical protein
MNNLPINKPPINKTTVETPFYNIFSYSNLNNFYCEIFDKDSTVPMTFYLQDVSLPSISLPIIEQANQEIGYTTKSNASDIAYGGLEMSFLLDEEWKSYLYFWNWKEQVIQTPEYYKQINIYITTNKKNITYVFFFTKCHLSEIGGLSFSSKITESTPIPIQISFEFEKMWFEVIKK